MGPLSIIALISLISGIVQISYPELLIQLKFQGARSTRSVRFGGFIALPVGIALLIIDILKR